mgnify:CR=1 FL=1
MSDKKQLVAYFSPTGNTRRFAEMIAKVSGADLFEIKPEIPYTTADLDWENPRSRSSVEMKDPTFRPMIKDVVASMQDYDVVFLGFPICGISHQPLLIRFWKAMIWLVKPLFRLRPQVVQAQVRLWRTYSLLLHSQLS